MAPKFSVYALSESFPRALKYKNAVCVLELARGADGHEWIFRARKIVNPTSCTIAVSRNGNYGLRETLKRGFIVEDGSPASLIMDRLVREGHARKRQASRDDFKNNYH